MPRTTKYEPKESTSEDVFLFYGGYGKYQFYTVATDANTAVKQIQEQYNMKHLPVTVKEINGIDGYTIKPIKG